MVDVQLAQPTTEHASSNCGVAITSNAPVETPLQSGWQIYFSKKPDSATNLNQFAHSLNELGSFNTLEGFWRHYSFMSQPSDLASNLNVMVFREGLTPAWESFPKGGCWIVRVRKGNGIINRLWEELLISVVCELFHDLDLVGVTLSVRERNDMLSVWTQSEKRFPIGERLKEILSLDMSTLVEYQLFSNATKNLSTFRNTKAYVYAVNNNASQVGVGGGNSNSRTPPHGGANSYGGGGGGRYPGRVAVADVVITDTDRHSRGTRTSSSSNNSSSRTRDSITKITAAKTSLVAAANAEVVHVEV